jgi:putative hemolysin
VLSLAGCATVDTEAPETTTPASNEDAAAYCEETGGTVETRHPYWNTNGDQSAWIRLPGELDLCWYQTLGDEDDSRIYLDLNTLYSETPTLAAAAYLAQLPLSGDARGNPAAINCNQQLQGTASFGNTAAGGGWVNLEDEVFTVVNLCVFPDGSAIDEWGIAYYTDGTARGIDLTEVFRFDPDDVPPMFEG